MRPRGNALPPTAGRRASLWHQVTNERGGRRVCCLEQLSSLRATPVFGELATRRLADGGRCHEDCGGACRGLRWRPHHQAPFGS